MLQRTALCLLVLVSLSASRAQAAAIIYTTNPVGPPGNVLNEHTLGDIGTSSFFDIFVRTDVPLVGISLDLELQGDAIILNDIPVLNPASGATPRWTEVTPGTVAADGKSAASINAYTLSNPGLNPATAGQDAGYDADANAYHFARVNYNIVQEGEAAIWLKIGGNEIGASTPTDVFLGFGDAAACNTDNFDCVGGAISLEADGLVTVVPEPASLALIGLALLGMVGVVRRHR